MTSPTEIDDSGDFKYNWVVFYFKESQREWTDRQLLGKMLHDLENPLLITWTPNNPIIDKPYTYSLFVITIDDDVSELLFAAQKILAEYIRVNGTDNGPFNRNMIFPPQN